MKSRRRESLAHYVGIAFLAAGAAAWATTLALALTHAVDPFRSWSVALAAASLLLTGTGMLRR